MERDLDDLPPMRYVAFLIECEKRYNDCMRVSILNQQGDVFDTGDELDLLVIWRDE